VNRGEVNRAALQHVAPKAHIHHVATTTTSCSSTTTTSCSSTTATTFCSSCSSCPQALQAHDGFAACAELHARQRRCAQGREAGEHAGGVRWTMMVVVVVVVVVMMMTRTSRSGSDNGVIKLSDFGVSDFLYKNVSGEEDDVSCVTAGNMQQALLYCSITVSR
jgi:hypothetical protein